MPLVQSRRLQEQDHLPCDLRPHAGAQVSHARHDRRVAIEDRTTLFEHLGRATDHRRELTRLRTLDRTGHAGVEEGHTGVGSRGSNFEYRLDVNRRMDHHPQTGMSRGQNPVVASEHTADLIVVQHDDQDEVRGGRYLSGRGRDGRTLCGESLTRLGVRVIHGEGEASPPDSSRHRGAHVPDADHPDTRAHSDFPSGFAAAIAAPAAWTAAVPRGQPA